MAKKKTFGKVDDTRANVASGIQTVNNQQDESQVIAEQTKAEQESDGAYSAAMAIAMYGIGGVKSALDFKTHTISFNSAKSLLGDNGYLDVIRQAVAGKAGAEAEKFFKAVKEMPEKIAEFKNLFANDKGYFIAKFSTLLTDNISTITDKLDNIKNAVEQIKLTDNVKSENTNESKIAVEITAIDANIVEALKEIKNISYKDTDILPLSATTQSLNNFVKNINGLNTDINTAIETVKSIIGIQQLLNNKDITLSDNTKNVLNNIYQLLNSFIANITSIKGTIPNAIDSIKEFDKIFNTINELDKNANIDFVGIPNLIRKLKTFGSINFEEPQNNLSKQITILATAINDIFKTDKAGNKELTGINHIINAFKAFSNIEISEPSNQINTLSTAINNIYKTDEAGNKELIGINHIINAFKAFSNIEINEPSNQINTLSTAINDIYKTDEAGNKELSGINHIINAFKAFSNIEINEPSNQINTLSTAINDIYKTDEAGNKEFTGINHIINAFKAFSNIEINEPSNQINTLSTAINDIYKTDEAGNKEFTGINHIINAFKAFSNIEINEPSNQINTLSTAINDIYKTDENGNREFTGINHIINAFKAFSNIDIQEPKKQIKIFSDSVKKIYDIDKIATQELTGINNIINKVKEINETDLVAIKPELDLSDLEKEANSKEIDNIATNIKSGILKELGNTGNKPESEILNFQEGLTEQLRNAFQIHSPSELMSQAIGEFIKEGIINGIKLNKNDITSIEEFKNSLVGAFEKSNIPEAIQNTLDTIKPFTINIGKTVLTDKFSNDIQLQLNKIKGLTISINGVNELKESLITTNNEKTIDTILKNLIELNKNAKKIKFDGLTNISNSIIEFINNFKFDVKNVNDHVEILNAVLKNIQTTLTSASELSKTSLLDLYTTIDNFVKQINDSKNNIDNASVSLDNIQNEIFNKISNLYTVIIPEVKKNINTDLSDIANGIQTLTTIVANLNTISTSAKDIDLTNLSTLSNNFKQSISSLADSKDNITQATGELTAISDLAKSMQSISDLSKNISLPNLANFSDSLKAFVDNLEHVNAKVSLQNINDIFELIDKIQYTSKIDTKAINKNLEELIGFFNEDKKQNNKNLHALINAILNVMPNDTEFEVKEDLDNVTDIFNIIESLTDEKFEDVDELSYRIEDLNETIFSGETGSLPSLIRSINDLPKSNDFAALHNSIALISETISSITQIADLGFFDIVFMPFKIKFIEKVIASEISDLIIALDREAKRVEKEIGGDGKGKKTNFGIIANFIQGITHLADIKGSDRRRMYRNLKFIKHFLLSDLIDMYKDISKAADDSEKHLVDVQQITGLLEAVIKIGDLSFWKIFKLKIKAKMVSKILTGFVNTVINSLPGGKRVKEGKRKLNLLKQLIKGVENFYDKVPGLMKSAKVMLKLLSLHGIMYYITKKIMPEFKKLGTAIDKYIPNKQKITGFKTKITDFIPLIDKIASLTKHINAVKVGISKAKVKQIIAIFGWFNSKDRKSLISKLRKINITGSPKKVAASGVNDDFSRVRKMSEMVNQINKVCMLGALLAISGGPALIGFKLAAMAVESFKTVIKGLPTAKQIESKEKSLKEFVKLTVLCAGLLLIGSFMMKYISITAIGKFIGGMFLFIGSMIAILKIIQHFEIKTAMKSTKEFGELVAICAGVMILGSIFAAYIKFEDMITFTSMLSGFMLLLCIPLLAMKPLMKKALKGVKEFGVLIMMCGATLALGSLITQFVDWKSILTFGGMLFGFMTLLCIPILILSHFMKKAIKGIAEFGILVMACGYTLALGSMITQFVDPWSLVLFTGMLIALVVGVTLPFILTKKQITKAIEGAIELGVLVMLCGFTLALGALITKSVGWENLLAFSVMLWITIIGTAGIFKKWGEEIMKSIPAASALAILIGVTGVTLMLGAFTINALGGPIKGLETMGVFALILIGTVFALLWVYNKNAKKIEKALLPAAALAILVAISTYCLIMGAKAINKYGWKDMVIYAGIMIVFTGAMALVCGIMGKFVSQILLGAVCMVAIVGITILMTYALKQLALASKEVSDPMKLLKDFGVISLIITGVGVFAAGLGAIIIGTGGIGAAALAIGAGIILAITGIVYLMAKTMKAIAEAAQEYEKVKNFDVSGAGKFVTSFMTMYSNISLLDIITIGLKVRTVKKAALGMSVMISECAKAVQESSSLTIPIYAGTKVIGYRHLNGSDFNKAAQNTKKIITVLGGAIVDAYNKNPDIFFTDIFGNSPFGNAVKAFNKMGPLISNIAIAVQQAAALIVGEDYKMIKGTMKPTKYRHLNNKDFKNAAVNVKTIITTLGQAIVDAYKENPEIFETNFVGNSPFSKAVKAFNTMGPLISNIASSVSDAANLVVGLPESYKVDKNGNYRATKFRSLDNNDFQNASTNIQHIITTLGGAIVDAYQNNPEMFETNFWGNSPFSKAVQAFNTMGPLISNIAESVNYASNLVVGLPESYKPDKNGYYRATKFRSLNNTDFKNASTNIQHIITTLGGAIVNAYNNNKEMFETNFWGNSPFSKAVKAFNTMGPLISNIASSVSDAANLVVATEWETDPKSGSVRGKKFRSLDRGDFQAASQNIQLIMSTLGGSIIAAYEAHPDYYESTFGDTPFEATINANIKLGNLIAKISEGIKDYAELKIPVWGKGEKPESYRNLNDKDFKSAADNIALVITTLGGAVMAAYEDHVTWFEDGEDSPFGQACVAISTMGTMIANIAEGIKSYSELKFATGYDREGKATGYSKLKDQDFKNASNHIGLVVSTLATSLINIYNGDAIVNGKKMPMALKDMLSDDDDSPMKLTLEACVSMGEMITSIATGIQSYAELKFATAWDNKGKPTAYQALKPNNFTEAANNIGLVVTTLVNSLLGIWNGTAEVNGKQLGKGFADMLKNTDDEDSPLTKMIDACTSMGDMISSIATGIQEYATLNVPEYKNGKIVGYRQLEKTDFTKASKNIGAIITTLGKAIVDVYNNDKDDIFKYEPAKSNDGFFGIGATKTEASKSPFEIIASSCVNLGTMIGSISRGLINFANLNIPIIANGKITGVRQMDKNDFKKAGENIGEILTILGKTVVTVYKQNASMWSNNMGQKVVEFSAGVGKTVAILANAIKQFSNLTYTDYDERTGKKLGTKRLGNDEIKACGTIIQNVLTTIGKAFYDTYNGNPELFNDTSTGKGSQKVANVIKAYTGINNVLGQLSTNIQKYSMLLVPKFDEQSGKYIKGKYHKLSDTEIQHAGDNIGKIISAIGKGIVEATKIGSPNYQYTAGAFIGKNAPAVNVATAISKLSGTISTIANCIGYYASGDVPILTYDANGKKKTTIFKLNDTQMNTAGTRIGTILTAIGRAVSDTYDNNEDLFEDSKLVNNVINGITGASKAINLAAQTILNIQKQQLDTIDTDSLLEYSKHILTFISDLSNEMFKTIFYNNMEFAIKNSPTVTTGLGNFTSVYTNMLSNIDTINKTYQKVKDAVTAFADGTALNNTSNIIDSLNAISVKMFGAPKGLAGDAYEWIFGKDDSKMTLVDAIDAINDNGVKTINDGLISFQSIYTNILKTITYMNQYTVKASGTNIFYKSLQSIIGSLGNAAKQISDDNFQKQLKSARQQADNIDNFMNIISNMYSTYVTIGKITTDTDNFNVLLSKFIPKNATGDNFAKSQLGTFIDVMSNMPATFVPHIQQFVGSINSLSTTYDNMANMSSTDPKENKMFALAYTVSNKKSTGVYDIMAKFNEANLNKIKKFRTEIGLLVTNINKIENNTNGPMDKMVALANAMARIAEKFDKNGMGELAKALGVNLTNATTYLADEVKAANATIKNSEANITKREKSINEAIKNAKNMMAQTINVLVKADTSATAENTNTEQEQDQNAVDYNNSGANSDMIKEAKAADKNGDGKLSENEINTNLTGKAKDYWMKQRGKQPNSKNKK